MTWIVIGFIAACAILGRYVSTTKHRPEIEGVVFGALLGPIGVLIAAVLPNREATRPATTRVEASWHAKLTPAEREMSRNLRP